jgi:hypothetical protein
MDLSMIVGMELLSLRGKGSGIHVKSSSLHMEKENEDSTPSMFV